MQGEYPALRLGACRARAPSQLAVRTRSRHPFARLCRGGHVITGQPSTQTIETGKENPLVDIRLIQLVATIWLGHIPALYELAVRSESVHTLQHATFVSTSVLFWWGLIYGRYGRAGYGAAVFYVFTTAIHTGILGALLTFTRVPVYGVYATPEHIDPLGDQQLAGLVMWIPAGLLLTMIGVGLFAAWLGEAERRAAT
jgi:cytochrome c oxidase assembly factor CtaG